MFFQHFLGGMTLKIIPSEKGSMLSTNSSSALPPKVIIYVSQINVVPEKLVNIHQNKTHLIHLLQFHRNQAKPSHKLVESLLPKPIVLLFLLVSEVRDVLEVLSAFEELLLTF